MTQPGAGMINPHVAAPQTARNPGMTMPGGATASLAGVRTDGMSLGMPGQLMNETPEMTSPVNDASASNTATKAAGSQSTPKLAMEGYCAVTVIDEDKWVEGNPKFGVIHLGKLYLFSSSEKMQTFLSDPEPYTPVLNEIDVVRFFEERQVVQGKRRFGMRDPVHQRMFFFADEAAMNHFFNDYLRYTDAAIEVMSRAVADANPQSE
jgi:protein disulfide-isomerase